MSPIPAVLAAAAIVTVAGDAVTASQDIGNGPFYGMAGVLGAALIYAVSRYLTDRRRNQPQTPDVTSALSQLRVDLNAGLAELRSEVAHLTALPQQVARLETKQEAAFQKIADNRHEQKNITADLRTRLELIERHLRPWRDGRKDGGNDD